jgi:hypothetical protein
MVHSARTTSGNMLIYILGAIFLMGLLIVLVKGNFQEGTGVDAEKVLMQVNEVQRYGSEMERGVRYILQEGFSESQLRFASPNSASYGDITDFPRQQVFSESGGGVEWRDPPRGSQLAGDEWIFSGANTVPLVGSTCGLAECSDLVVILPNVTEAFCTQVNRTKDIDNTGGVPPEDADSFDKTTYFTNGVFTYGGIIDTSGNEADGKAEGCVDDAGSYFYYRVLLPR